MASPAAKLYERAAKHYERTLSTIEVRNIGGTGYHGVLPEERQLGQTFSASVKLWVDTFPAGTSDRLDRTVNYAEVAVAVEKILLGEPRQLVETVAENIAGEVLAEFPLVKQVEVSVHKPQAPIPVQFEDVIITVKRLAAPVPVVLSLGSNLGDKAEYLRQAIRRLEKHKLIVVKQVADFIRTAPVGGVEQDDFLNTVVLLETVLSPFELLDFCQELEAEAERERIVHWGPRTLDVDIVKYGELQLADPDLTLPHPEAKNRAFVLAPWLSVDELAQLDGVPVKYWLAEVGVDGILGEMDSDRE